MNKLYIYLLLSLILGSCKKLIQIPSNAPGQLVTSEVFADSIGAVNGVVGIYTTAFSNNSPLCPYMSEYPSLSADDLTTSDPYNQVISNNALTAGSATDPSGTTGVLWSGFYGSAMIYQTNAVIEGVSASPTLSTTLKNQLIGECETIRALCYFSLINLYGPAPLALTTNYQTNSQLHRTPVDSVYAQIMLDLSDAMSRLSADYPSEGHARPNKYTAMALLSRVCLYTSQWVRADSLATAIINSGIYSLDALSNLFTVGNQEAIWQAAATGYYGYTAEGPTFLPYAPGIVPEFFLTTNLLSAFEPGDQRFTNWLDSVSVGGVTYYYPYKYKNNNGVQVNGAIEGEVLFRLAEQYLIRAEAKIQEGELGDAEADINLIRQRAGLAATGASTPQALLTAVLHERQVEYFCEWGHRWLDLKRLGLLNSVMNAEKPGVWPSDGHAALYPIPYGQMQLNPGWKQNPGY